jgi:FkbM family methyltransferase
MSAQPDPQPLEKIEKSLNRLHNLMSEVEDILETLVTNDTEILEALTQILLVVPQMQARNEQNQARVIEELRKEIAQLGNPLTAHLPALHGAPAVTDPFLVANPEVAILQSLYAHLPDPIALDIGAHVGDMSRRLLAAGFEVYAFEPNPPAFESLSRALESEKRFRAFPYAIGSSDCTMNLHVAAEAAVGDRYGAPTLFSSLVEHPMPADLPFTHDVPVPVRTVASLRNAGEIPPRAGLIKIDTEGYDIEVLRGLGADATPVVMTEYWDASHSFGRTGKGRLAPLVEEMRDRGYPWYLAIHHQEENGKTAITYDVNRSDTPPNSWGNAIFFREQPLFAHAHAWCAATLETSGRTA